MTNYIFYCTLTFIYIIQYNSCVMRYFSMVNTKQRAGGPCCKMKNMTFPGAGDLHRRAGWQAALQDGPVGCKLSWASEKGGLEGCPFLQLAGPPFCAACWPALLSSVQPTSPPKIHVFHLETRPFSLPSPPISVSLFPLHHHTSITDICADRHPLFTFNCT